MIDTIDSILHPLTNKLSPEVFERLRRHLFSQVVCLGRHTITGLLTTQGRLHQDWSADYRLYSQNSIESSDIFDAVLAGVDQTLPAHCPLVTAIDDSLLRKCGRKTPGVRWMRDPLGPPFNVNFVRAQRVLQFSAAIPDHIADTKTNSSGSASARLIPIDFAHVPPAPKIKNDATEVEKQKIRAQQKELNINRIASEHLDQLAQKTSRPVVAVSDGRFANKTFLRDRPDKITMVARIRKDTALFHPPQMQAVTGRKRLYGEKAPTPEQLRVNDQHPWQRVRGFACAKFHQFRIKELCPVVCPVTGGKPAKVVVIAPLGYRLKKGGKILYRQPAFLICTDPNLSIQAILQYYLWRWDIEVNFRDEKTLLGVGQAQVRNERSCQKAPSIAVAAYALLLLAGSKIFPPYLCPQSIPKPAWRKVLPVRNSTSVLINHLRYEMFSHALSPRSFRGFWSKDTSDQSGSKLSCSAPASLFCTLN